MRAPSPHDRPSTVTVIVTTYNHAKFVGQCLDSVLMQQVDGTVDIVVLDDCSTDGTQAILVDYQRRYPGRIRPVLSDVNRANCAAFAEAVLEATTPYVSVLDGDDYWTRDDKLQRQVDYLDQHPECALCFHNVSLVYDDGSRPPVNSNPADQKAVSSLTDLLEFCFVPTCSTLYRRSAVQSFPAWYIDDPSADWSMVVIAATHGTIDYLDEVMAVYRQHAGGVWSRADWKEQGARVIRFYEQMRGFVPLTHEPQVTSLLARHYHDLAWAYTDAGAADVAEPLFEKAFAVEPDRRRLAWAIRTASANVARLVFPPGAPDAIRVEIARATSDVAFDIQLNHPHLTVTANQRYRIRFQARSERPRALTVGVALAHAPWDGLGYHRAIDLSTDWRSVQEEFVASATTMNARVHFDVGGHDAAVDLASVSLVPIGAEAPLLTGVRR